MAMIKLGKKYGEMGGCAPAKSMKDKVYYPTLDLDKVKPSGLSVGDVVVAKVKLRLKRASENQDQDGERHSCTFDVLAIDLPAKSRDGAQYAVDQESTRRSK